MPEHKFAKNTTVSIEKMKYTIEFRWAEQTEGCDHCIDGRCHHPENDDQSQWDQLLGKNVHIRCSVLECPLEIE